MVQQKKRWLIKLSFSQMKVNNNKYSYFKIWNFVKFANHRMTYIRHLFWKTKRNKFKKLLCFKNCTDISPFQWLKKPFEIRSWRPRICKRKYFITVGRTIFKAKYHFSHISTSREKWFLKDTSGYKKFCYLGANSQTTF